MYHELIYHLDLCILSYHLYSQTLVWPMDPYYEQMARKGTSRRTNFMNEVRKSNAAFPIHLDPILADYSRVDPRRPCFVKPIDDWLVYQAPTQITDPIRKTFLMNKNKQVTEILNQIASPQPSPTDDLYCFEGVTGAIKGKPGEPSIMGCVLARKVQNSDDYDIHIVFRGSRSGSAGRAATQGLFSERGNPDWVTDTDARPLVAEPEISLIGKCSRGFATSMKEIMPVVFACLSNIAQNKNGRPPRQIYVTGHSLGGALAAHFASAVIMGNKSPMPGNITAWPWSTLKLITFSAPTVGDEVFRSAFNSKVPVRRVMLGQDLVTQERINYHVGARVKIPGKALPNVDDHEPYRIRRKLLSMVRTIWDEANQLATTPANTGEEHLDEPWKVCKSFADVLNHPKFNGDHRQNVVASLEPFKNHLIRYLNTLQVVQGMDSSYKKNILTKAADKAAKQAAIINLVSDIKTDMWENTTNWWLSDQTRKVFDKDTYNYLGLCIVLNRLAQQPNSADNLPAPLQTCISTI